MSATTLPTDMVGHVRFGRTSLEDATRWLISDAIPRRLAVNVRLANAYNVALAQRSREYMRLLNDDAHINLPDGTPVAWVLRMFKGRPDAGLVRGPSLFRNTLEATQNGQVKHYFLGSSPDVLHALRAAIEREYPGVRIAGMHSPPFADVDDDFLRECVAQVSQGQPDLVWVGLGTPKQDLVGTRIAGILSLPVVNVGAAFDFVAGTVPEAPAWLRNSGLEWVYRLSKEPRRLWRRYAFGNAVFIWAAISGSRRNDGS
ncbi:WecB/TagA/CpsF family glycosyltransferase [Microbacterium arborescens]